MSSGLLKGVHPSLDLKGSHTSLTPARVRLLLALQDHGSISAAARAVKMSYKGAWDAIAALNAFAAEPLVQTELGGPGGGGARLTETGRRLLAFYEALETLHERVLTGAVDGNFDHLLQRVNNLMLRTSARNQYEGTVTALQRGAVNSQVTLRLDGDDELVSIITNDSVDNLGLAVGASAITLIKASFVILSNDDDLRLSARNRLRGVVSSCRKGAVNAEVVLTLAAGKQLVATVTNDSIDDMGILQGMAISAIVKASHVILAVAV